MVTLKQKVCSYLYRKIAINLPRTGTFFNMGTTVRVFLCRRIFRHCGLNIGIDKGVDFGLGYDVEIGNYSALGINCKIPNGCIIGDYVMFGPNVEVMSRCTHEFTDTTIPICKQGMRLIPKTTIIGDDVWIGKEVLVLGGKSIGSHSIIGARSVVSKDIPESVIAAGNPIRVIRYR